MLYYNCGYCGSRIWVIIIDEAICKVFLSCLNCETKIDIKSTNLHSLICFNRNKIKSVPSAFKIKRFDKSE